jgi:pyruvyltransferase
MIIPRTINGTIINMSQNIEMYWWNGAWNKNFGDVLGPELIKRFTEKTPIWVSASESSLVTVGSILEHLPENYEGTVAGIGVAHKETKKSLENANVVCLRGRLTLAASQIKNVPLLSDPGLLAPDLLTDLPEKQYEFGIIPHYADKTKRRYPKALHINILDPIDKIIFNAAKCKKIVSSSLHGIILADSLQIPRKWVRYDKVQGDGYKFFDYASSFDQSIKENVWISAPEKQVKEKQEALREIFSCL